MAKGMPSPKTRPVRQDGAHITLKAMRRIARAVVLAFLFVPTASATAHGGGLNKCGCHFNRKTGECHCHRPTGCGCTCQPARCESQVGGDALDPKLLRARHSAGIALQTMLSCYASRERSNRGQQTRRRQNRDMYGVLDPEGPTWLRRADSPISGARQ